MKPDVTAEMLEGLGACDEQVEIFKREWPDGARMIEQTLRKAIRLELDIHFFGLFFFHEAESYKADRFFDAETNDNWNAKIRRELPAQEFLEMCVSPLLKAWKIYNKEIK